MQEDSINSTTSEHTTQNQVITASSSTSFLCSHCTLLFKTKVYLFEHLHKVHGFDIDVAIREAGVKHPGTSRADTRNSLGDVFECQRCDFTACDCDVLNEHERQCHKKPEDRPVIRNLVICENPGTIITVTSTNQGSKTAGAKEIMSTSKSKCTLNSSKDLKTYKRPLQTITKFFAASSHSNEKPPVKSAESPKLQDATKGTIILQESPSSSAPNSSGVFKVTAKSTIDITRVTNRFLLNDHLLNTDLRPPKPKERSKETVPDGVGTKTNTDGSKMPPLKKAKLENKDTNLPNAAERQLSGNTEFSFDISEDEGEKRLNLVSEDPESSKVYFCKHCEYSGAGITCLSMHYQNHHPYARYNAAYIQDPSDDSATFRCLHCPVEFVSVADLKRHYTDTHPEAPDVFTMQSRELGLAFKCFTCLFTTSVLKALKKHYTEIHPTHKVDNSLMYYRYSVTGSQEVSAAVNVCEKGQSPERRGEISPETSCSPCEVVKNTPSPQHPTSTGADVLLYHCNNCTFSHKSVVVMHVHYQKSHPGEDVTIDKIRQSACVTSKMTPDKSPNSATLTKTPAPQTDILDPPKKRKAEPSQHERTSEGSKTRSESSKAEPAEDRCRPRKSPIKRIREESAGMNSLSCGSPNGLFYCQYCSYSSVNIKSVVGHHNAKHALHVLTCMEEIAVYSAEVGKRKCQSEAGPSASTTSSHSKTRKQVAVDSEEVQQDEDKAEDASSAEGNAYARAENLFYCQMCNYGNPSVKGVANHQTRIHKTLHYSKENIVKHTYLMCKEIKKSKSQPKELSFATRLPLPLMNEGDVDMFFCYFCNYRQSTVEYVSRHCLKKHRGFLVKGDQIRLYTNMVREKTQKSRLNTTSKLEVNHASLKRKGIKTKNKQLGKSLSVSAAHSVTASQPQRTLQCYRCTYTTQYVYVLRRHVWKTHRANRSISDVLRVCFKQGDIQAGFHCDLCVFSHKKAVGLHEHYQEQHPGRRPSLEYVMTRLYVGPNMCSLKRKRPQTKRTDAIAATAADGSSPSQRSGQNETKTYSCRACSFKSGSVSAITHHYRAVHPWSVKEDGSVLGVVNSKRPSVSRQVEEDDDEDNDGSFESYQVPLEFDTPASSTMLYCPYCPASFHTQHGLNTHCGMKHHEEVNEDLDKQENGQSETRMHVFKCPHCSYVNTSYQGVLTHCHMKHPTLESSVYSHHVDEAQLTNWGGLHKSKSPGNPGNLKIRGYMCESCPQLCVTLEKLNKHCKKAHSESVTNTAPSAMKAAPEPSAGSKIKQHKTLSNWGAASQASFLNRKMIKCQYCPFSCRTKIALDRHVRVDHKKALVSKLQDCMYKCVLCSSSYFTKIRLGSHYVKKHGRDSFLKFYAPVYKQAQEKPASHDCPEQPEDTHEARESSVAAEEKETLLVYRCPTCSYVNTSYHGTLTHCQMKHPDLIARADELQTEEVLETNMVGCTIGKGHNQRGYTCKICPLIYPSVKKLKIHCEKFHDVTSAVSASKTTLEKCQSDSLPTEKKETLYQCHICPYATLRRRYLQCHLKKTHRLDALTTHYLLQKYNKRNRRPPEADTTLSAAEGSAAIRCKKCPELKFDSSQLLVDHYSAFHSSIAILDFAVLSQGKKKGSTGLYRCNHCNKQMNGIRKLCNHLDHHRERAKKRAESYRAIASLEAQSIELCKQDELLMLERAEDESQWNVTSAQTFSLPPSPLSSSSKPTDAEQPQPEPRDVKHACKQCRRTFMSLKGLRSHERSHAAVAALKLSSLPATVLKHSINKYVLYKAGTIRPFLCSICSYRTAVMGLMRSHLRKVHQNAIMDLAESDTADEENVPGADTELFNASEQFNNWPELDKESEITEKSLYLEPPDVQRQLSHYNLMAQANSPSKRNVSDTKLPANCLLYCEFCNFNTGHLSSVRRHYLNRHGKKFLRCKDCEFFTGSRKTLEMHMEAGHSTCQSEPTHQKDLRCPFCLYQTKNKNNMIDHIVLHREERVVPIEVRRPKLSRYLQGIVFRCHQCTFSSGSADNLRSHMARHDDIKPYKCRLCYFDCTRLSDLEAHLSDKHQVLRNHELVGQVSLDELDARVGRRPEEEPPSDNEHHHNDGKDVETEEFVNDCDVVLHETQAKDLNTRGEIAQQPKEAYLKQGQCGKNEESSVKSSLFDLWREDAKPNAAVRAKHECDPEEPAEMVFLPARPKVRDGEVGGITLAPPKHEAAEGSPITFGEITGRKQAHKLQKTLQYRTMDIDAQLEDDLLRDIQLLDEDVGVLKRHKKANHDRTIRTEKDTETKAGDRVRSEMTSRGKNQVNTETISAPAMKNQMYVNNSRPEVEGHSQTLSSKCAKLKHMSHKESLDVSFTNCKKEQLQNSKHSEEREPYGEMPVLENEYLKKEMEPVVCCKEEDLSDHFEQKQDKEGEAITEDVKDGWTDRKHEEGHRRNEAGNPRVPKGALAAMDGAPEGPCPAATEDKPFTCEFCGRNLVSSSELTRHIMRHGL